MRIFPAILLPVFLVACGNLTPSPAGTAVVPVAVPDLAVDSARCDEHLRRHHAGQTSGERRATMEAELQDYLRLAEEALSMRAGAIRLHQELKSRIAGGEPLTGHDLRRLNEGAAALLAQREALMKIAEAHECWIYAPLAENPQEAGLRATGVAMSLSAALILFDNYLSAVAPFRHDLELRQHLNRSDRGFDINAGTLDNMAVNFASLDNRRRTRMAAEWVEKHARTLSPEPFEQYGYLLRSIEQSPSLQLVRRVNPLRDMASNLDFLRSLTIDTVFTLKNESTNLSSLLFGNTIGLVETRRGKLHDQPSVAHRVGTSLRAGDILVEKTPFRLTDTFIPGHWGHAAIWIGNEAELRALGIWAHPVVVPHQEAIRAGHGVVEALRSGVQVNTVAHFLNVDDLAVLRDTAQARERQAEIILQTLRQVGKAYDFNFDAETTHRIFCSKLVYLAYGDLQWPTSRMLGRVTVSPDNIAARATADGPLSVVLLYHDGQEITDQPRQAMEQLMRSAHLELAQREKARQPAEPNRQQDSM